MSTNPPLLTTPVTGAASSSVWRRLRAGRMSGKVLHSGTHALYARFGDEVIGVAARGAIHAPVTIGTNLPHLPVVTIGDPATIHDATLYVAGLAVSVGRLVPSAAPRLTDPMAAARRLAPAMLTPDVAERVAGVRSQLPADGLLDLAAGDPTAVSALLGRGDGLTPVGDDVIAGWLAATSACGHRSAAINDAVRAHAHRTTTLSAALLAGAGAGECLPEFRALLLALSTGHDVVPAVTGLLGVGHTSGVGMLLGARLALPVPAPQTGPVTDRSL